MRPSALPVLAAGLTLLGMVDADAAPPRGDRPNVVLIVADDLGGADLGCYGSTYHRTPHLDRLAAEGVRFTAAYSACPVCSPTRAALLTGRHPARLHLTDWLPGRRDIPAQRLLRPDFRQELPLEEVTLAEVLRSAGYATAHIGKWHLGGEGFGPAEQGFDLNIAGDRRGAPPSYFAPYLRDDRVMAGLEDSPEGEYLTDRLTEEAERFIAAHRDEPFFLYLPHFAVHAPLQAKPDWQATYAPWDGTPHGRQENPIYAAMLESLDASVGRVVSALAEHGLTERTLVVFTSDNGGLATREGPDTPSTHNGPFREGKGWLYDGGLRVPLIARWSGRIAPGENATPVFSADLPLTALELCGQQPPADVLDGVSLAGLLTEGEALAPRPFYWHYPHYSNQGGRPGGALRDGDWKLIEFYDTGRRELFDLASDPSESRNLAEDDPQRVADLAAKLAAWRESVGAQLPSPNPDYAPNAQRDDGTIVLPAETADVHGAMLRYEPLPHKDTLGYWVRQDDWAEWEFEVRQPGEFDVTALVGCGAGSGGSEVEFRCGQEVLHLTVAETGGFQQFQPQPLGRLSFPTAGRYRLEVRATSKPGVAVMDLREVRLVPADE